MNNKSILATSSIAVLIAIFIGLNTISERIFSNFSIDLTQEGLYSLSEGTKKILTEMQEPVILRLYLSKSEGAKYPLIKIYGKRVKDLLASYQAKSNKIKVEYYDPRQDSEDQEWAQKYGLTPIPLPTGGELYFGLVAVNSLGKEEVLPLFDIQRQEFLEYDITKLIYSLGKTTKPVIGLISPLNVSPSVSQVSMEQQEQDKWVLVSQLEKFAKVISLGTEVASISDEVEELLIIHPKSLSDKTLFAIDQFLMKGGRLFIAVDPFASVDAPPADPQNPMANLSYARNSNMEKLFTKWGIDFEAKKVVGDMNLAANVSISQGSPPVRFPAWLMLNNSKDNINKESVITSQLENLVFAWPGYFKLSKKEGIETEILFKTTNESGTYPESEMRYLAENPQELTRRLKPDGEEKILALSLKGKFESAFDAGIEGAEHIKASTSEGVIVLLGDVDLLADRYSTVSQNLFGTKLVSLINDNLIFFANASENLVGSNSLISLRSRGKFARPFTKVQEIELAAQEKWQAEEESLQSKLTAANQRLAQLESGDKSKGTFSNAMMEEIRKFREQRSETQSKLRDVRRKLREDKEGLGNMLFFINAFFVPTIIILTSFFVYGRREAK